MNTKKRQEIWVLGLRKYKGADKSIKWFSFLPNFVDCDCLIIDLPSLNNLLLFLFYSKLKRECNHIYEMVSLGGSLICITTPIIEQESKIKEIFGSDNNFYDNYDWIPMAPKIEQITTGKKISLSDNVFLKNYYDKFVSNYSFHLSQIEKYVQDDSIVYTKAGNIIGCSIQADEGYIHFLPPPSFPHSTKEAIEFIIKELRGEEDKAEKLIAPEWMNNYITRNERELKFNLDSLNSKRNSIEKTLENYNKINAMVWACGDLNNGKVLENAVKIFFEKELKLLVDLNEPGAHTDLTAETIDGRCKFAIEITGLKDKVTAKTGKCQQITQYHWKKREREKILFIANTYCNKDLKERPSENFTRDVVETLTPLHVAMVTTQQLYNLWISMQEGKTTKEEIIKNLYQSEGIFDLKY